MAELTVEAPAERAAGFRPAYANYVLALLLAIYVLNNLDRQVINILAEPIKHELHLADWQVGIMSGISFALVYTMLAVPVARLAEYGRRPAIIAAAVAVWCGFTALSSMAQSFAQLCLCRFGVGVGEAGGVPPSQSLISDYFPKEKRSSALGLYAMGVPLGALIGMAFGGLVADAFGWRAAFLMAGAPGVVLVVLILATMKETRSNLAAHAAAAKAAQPPVLQAFRFLAAKPTFWCVTFGVGFKVMFTDGQGPFLASFFLRNHAEAVATLAAGFGLKPVGLLGISIGLINGVFGAFSAWLGGVIADRAAARDIRNVMIAPALALVVGAPAYIAALHVDSIALAAVLLMLQSFTNVFWAGPVYATLHGIVPPNLRATTTACSIFFINLMGIGAGPLVVGALSDMFAGPLGLGEAGGLRAALDCAALISLVGVGFYLYARRTIVADLAPEAH
ncbi:MAG: MFS transporter [Phenylobacterium sp.]|uniref:spinster family MFS transporter n=1 Tax=Phenylobacterium sp. TaxID=1871053 RepID=UPI0025E53977|nr:MFS transporter [Phenylobacterium sp.]MBI1197958.1 MFS transporter [Phenylobacterium sp.]